MRYLFLLFLFPFFATNSQAQLGGQNSYEFLNLNSSARVASLGGNQIAVKDNDPFLAADNPSLLNAEMNNKLALTYIDYLADVSTGFASFTRHIDSIGTFNVGVKYVDYGEFTETDAGGNELGTFSAGDYAFFLGYARDLDSNFSIGANVKTIYSSLYDYSSLGLAADLGLTYYNPKRQVTVALLAKNFGTQVNSYTEFTEEDLPFEIQMGVSKRLAKVPLRVSIIAQHLQQWDLIYDNPAQEQEEENVLNDQADDTRDKKKDGLT